MISLFPAHSCSPAAGRLPSSIPPEDAGVRRDIIRPSPQGPHRPRTGAGNASFSCPATAGECRDDALYITHSPYARSGGAFLRVLEFECSGADADRAGPNVAPGTSTGAASSPAGRGIPARQDASSVVLPDTRRLCRPERGGSTSGRFMIRFGDFCLLHHSCTEIGHSTNRDCPCHVATQSRVCVVDALQWASAYTAGYAPCAARCTRNQPLHRGIRGATASAKGARSISRHDDVYRPRALASTPPCGALDEAVTPHH